MRRALLPACGFAVQVAVAVAQTPPSGLDALSDDKLMMDLANRGQTALLERAFEINKVPTAQRDAMKALGALRQLNDPTTKMSASQRQAAARQIAAGIEAALPLISDPNTLMQQATALVTAGVERDVNTLEYWGENARTQAALRPVVEATNKLLVKASTEAKKQADAIANNIAGPDDPRAKKWEEMSTVATTAEYTQNMAEYYRALSLDKADPKRKEIAAKAIEFLKQYDTAESTVQPTVKLRVAKLHMASGEFDKAKEIFAAVAAIKEITPPPDAWQQWEARYFSGVSDLLAGDTKGAAAALKDVTDWQSQNLPKDKASQNDAAAATAMLEYRIASAENQDKAAVDILMKLVKTRPDLQSRIYEQLMSKLPADADLKSMDPLMLQGLIAAADGERQKPDDAQIDRKVLQRGIDAAKEMLARPDKVDPQLADTASLLVGFLLERLGQHPAAANAMLDYAAGKSGTPQNQQIALENALAVIAQLRSTPATADLPDTVKLYDRFLPIAIAAPFSRNEFAYEYARRLQLEGKATQAAEYFRKVPSTDKRYPSARFYQMVALQQRLDDEKLSPAERKQAVTEISALIDEVSKRLNGDLAAAKDDRERVQYRSMLARALLLAADVARREQNDPKRTLALLDKFEATTAGLPDEKELLGIALHTRVQAYMASGETNAATQTLVTLLKSKPGGEGAAIVYKLLQKLNEELEHARLAGDMDRTRQLARNRASLSGFLVEWARTNDDPNIKKFTYRYSVFDAATKQLAADLEEDPAKQKAQWQEALKLYRELETPEAAVLYKATLDPKSADASYPDPAVSLGIGLISYDLGDFAEAQKRLGQLLTDRKLGTPTMAVEEAGQTKLVQNDQYWDATIQLMRANVALASANPSDAAAAAAKTETTNYLKQLYVRYGRDVGGPKWSPEFEKLRKEIAPDLNPDEFTVRTTQPAASG